jgi:hypothetical protein
MIGHQSAAIKTYPANESLHVSPAWVVAACSSVFLTIMILGTHKNPCRLIASAVGTSRS